jgi:hypothetical protein
MNIHSAMHRKFFYSLHLRVLSRIHCVQARKRRLHSTHKLLLDWWFSLGKLRNRRELELLGRISNDLVKSLDLVNRRKLLSMRLGTSDSDLRNLIIVLRTTSLSH